MFSTHYRIAMVCVYEKRLREKRCDQRSGQAIFPPRSRIDHLMDFDVELPEELFTKPDPDESKP